MNSQKLLDLDLQFFSIDSDDLDAYKNTKQNEVKEQTYQKGKIKRFSNKKVFTQKQVNQIIKERIARTEKDKQKEIAEAVVLARSIVDEQRDHELKKLTQENEKLRAVQNRYKLEKIAVKMLSEAGIPANDRILDFVVRDEVEKIKEAVKALSDLLNHTSSEHMKEKLKFNISKVDERQTIITIKC